MEIYNDFMNIFFWVSIIFIVYVFLLSIQKAFDFFVLKNENTHFTLKKSEKLILWFSISLILNYIT